MVEQDAENLSDLFDFILNDSKANPSKNGLQYNISSSIYLNYKTLNSFQDKHVALIGLGSNGWGSNFQTEKIQSEPEAGYRFLNALKRKISWNVSCNIYRI